MKNNQRCGTCRFWDPTEDGEDLKPENPTGWCRRFPPRPAMEDPYVPYQLADWPVTRSAQWCGEWAADTAPEQGTWNYREVQS